MDGQDDEVPFARKSLEQLVEAPDRVRLHAELHARLHGELARKPVASLGDRGEIAFVINVDGRLPLDDGCAAGVGAVLVPVGADLKVHVVGEADFVDAALDGEGANVVHGKDGVVGEFGVHVVVGEHGVSNRQGEVRITGGMYSTDLADSHRS